MSTCNFVPQASAGPAAVSLSAFRHYYADEAWTWEVMALTKARADQIRPVRWGNQFMAEIEHGAAASARPRLKSHR